MGGNSTMPPSIASMPRSVKNTFTLSQNAQPANEQIELVKKKIYQ